MYMAGGLSSWVKQEFQHDVHRTVNEHIIIIQAPLGPNLPGAQLLYVDRHRLLPGIPERQRPHSFDPVTCRCIIPSFTDGRSARRVGQGHFRACSRMVLGTETSRYAPARSSKPRYLMRNHAP